MSEGITIIVLIYFAFNNIKQINLITKTKNSQNFHSDVVTKVCKELLKIFLSIFYENIAMELYSVSIIAKGHPSEGEAASYSSIISHKPIS